MMVYSSAVGAMLIELGYGEMPDEVLKQRIHDADLVALDFVEAVTGPWLVDLFPFRKCFLDEIIFR